MFSKKSHPVILIIISLAVIGVGFKVFTDPLGVLLTLLFAAAVIALVYFLYQRFLKKNIHGNTVSADYKRAAKQSAKRYEKKGNRHRRPSYLKLITSHGILAKKQNKSSLEKRKKEHNLTVIDGKKDKKKNRASF